MTDHTPPEGAVEAAEAAIDALVVAAREHIPPKAAVEVGAAGITAYRSFVQRAFRQAHEAGEIVWTEEYAEALEGLAVRMRAELAAEKARADEAVALLREWQIEGEHSPTCMTVINDRRPCDCGLDDLIDRTNAFLAAQDQEKR